MEAMVVVGTSSIADLKKFLLELASTEERSFEDAVVEKLTKSDDSLVDDLLYILRNETDLELRFRAFFGVASYHRRKNNHSEFKKVVNEYIDEFRNFSLHYHILSLMHKQFGDRDGILKSIEYGKLAVMKLNRHIGVLHNFCEAVVAGIEEELPIEEADINAANSFIETVITLKHDYAKFYCTKGRLLAQRGLFEEAQKNIIHAIDIENPASNDYAMRISDYKNYLSIIKTKKLYTKVVREIEEAKSSILSSEESIQQVAAHTKEQMEHMKTQNLQMLAFFTAIISFIIGSINIASKQKFDEAGMLMLILAGVLILVNVSVGVLLSFLKENMWKYIVVSLIGVFLILAGFVVHH